MENTTQTINLEDFGYVSTHTYNEIVPPEVQIYNGTEFDSPFFYKKEIKESLTDKIIYTIHCKEITDINGAKYYFTATFSRPNKKDYKVSVTDSYFKGDLVNIIKEVDDFFNSIYVIQN